MKKVVKNLLKYLLIVGISFSIIYTTISTIEQGGIFQAIAYKIYTLDESELYKLSKSEIEEYCMQWQEIINESYNENNFTTENEEIKNKNLMFKEMHEKYPAGMTSLITTLSSQKSMNDLYITSLIMGFVVGTAIYLMIDKDKKTLKVTIAIYILFIFLLGFIEGVGVVSGENLTLLARWIFPETYIIPLTIIFGLVIAIRIIRQKNIAKELNEKLLEKQQSKNEEK